MKDALNDFSLMGDFGFYLLYLLGNGISDIEFKVDGFYESLFIFMGFMMCR